MGNRPPGNVAVGPASGEALGRYRVEGFDTSEAVGFRLPEGPESLAVSAAGAGSVLPTLAVVPAAGSAGFAEDLGVAQVVAARQENAAATRSIFMIDLVLATPGEQSA